MIIPAGMMMFTCLAGRQRAVRSRSPGYTDPAATEQVVFK